MVFLINFQMDGFLFIDKEKGMTSFDVIRILKRKFKAGGVGFVVADSMSWSYEGLNAKVCNLWSAGSSEAVKIGHSGTLDPIATGLLVVGIGEATKLLEFLLGMDKTYEAEAFFGKISDTFDADGKIEDMVGIEPISLNVIKKVVQEKFIGEIEQFPPKFSAKKIGGKRAYDLARSGEEFSLKSSKITIHDFKIISFGWPILRFVVTGGSGMYVRSLIHDLGQVLGCGAYMSGLRRMKIGEFLVEDAVKVDDADQKHGFFPIEEVFKRFPSVELNEDEFNDLGFGKFVLNKKNVQEEVFFAKYKEKIVGVCELCKDGEFIKFKKRLMR